MDAARRELWEETGLTAPGLLESLGQFSYLPRKDVALFLWVVATMPDPSALVCRSTFLIGGRPVPEFDRFACPTWAEALPKLGKSLVLVLRPILSGKGYGSLNAVDTGQMPA